MKKLYFIYKISLSIVFILLFSFFSFSQSPHPIVNYFTATTFDNQIILNWEIQSGETCNGMKLLYSQDSVNFIEIADFPGICGDPNTASRYTFLHTNPQNLQNNYYKVRLGTQGDTYVISHYFIQIDETGYFIYNDPNTNSLTLYFENPNNEIWTLLFFNSLGKLEYEKKNLLSDKIILSQESFSNGLHYFILQSLEGKTIKGKFFKG